ncbi:aminotransferase class I/II-fold pyridoxal phosphate-dependent enzyme [Rubrobacter aplysinae]|uniref:aminotransferase class I/II-fold pyridoxal phosphate-dependent enzyme n=1 Tax=Rubrobacter aplysinae TaxID=909625 RepID=UPI00069FCD96|nr:aminotransferase class I/II-fold pyridoxal phosphate-dependent enzyme [Rubrobacter aplysinae]
MAEGWVESPGGRHHGAHAAAASRRLGLAREDFLDFSQNINPLGPPSGTLAAARAAISSATVYPDPGYTELRRALAGYLAVDPASILPTNGGTEALFLAALGLARSGARRALILDPTFSEYAAAAGAAGLEVVRRVAWRESGDRFVLDHSSLGEPSERDAVFLCNPNNPTGGGIRRKEVLQVAETVREAGAALVVDEAFADFAPELSVADRTGPGLIVARSFTKFFCVPGLRLGCLVTPEADRYGGLQPSWPVNVAAEAAGISAASEPGFTTRSVELMSELRAGMISALRPIPRLRVYGGDANFLLLRGPAGMPERLARCGMLVRGCEPFEGLGPEHFRVAVRGGEENRRLVDAVRAELSERP